MSFLLDTNICSAYIKKPGLLAHRFIQHGGGLHVSTIALAELYTWAELRPDPAPLMNAIKSDLLSAVQVLDFNADCSRMYGHLCAKLRGRGITIPPPDLMIATVAIVHNLTVVTHNVRDFVNIPDLPIVDWLTP
ncbi:MAG TPA: type II toxin-antitoxin system VapC family toxin [Planctomycetaceae bacterium]|nr:type II toxin-antitoxin system VapC family toxin [Planctomycetaceae bacterium]